MADIFERYSPSIFSGSTQQSRPPAPPTRLEPTDEAVVLYSRPILDALAQRQPPEMHAHDLAKELSARIRITDFAQFLAVIGRLADMSYVQIVDKDVTGNDLIRLIRKP